MGMTEFTFDSKLTNSFIRFGYDNYRGDHNFIPPIESELRRQLDPGFSFYSDTTNSHCNFIMTSNGKIVGRISAMVNKYLHDSDGTSVGTVGFFECIEDFAVASSLLDHATKWLLSKGIHRVWGPMNFDIWHGYRFMTKGFDKDLFCGEPYNKPYYPEYFLKFGFKIKQHWNSIEIQGRDALEQLLSEKKFRHDLFIEKGMRFREFNLNAYSDETDRLHNVLSRSFSGFIGFTNIPQDEFRKIFASSRDAIDPKYLLFIDGGTDQIIGFTASFLDRSQAVRSLRGKTHVISKLRYVVNRRKSKRIIFFMAGVASEFAVRYAGLGSAVVYRTIRSSLNEGYDHMLVALMAKGNKAQVLFKNSAIYSEREYALFELDQ